MTSKLAGKVAVVTGGSAASGLASPNVSRTKARGRLSPAARNPNWIRQLL
jgi:hypothetical protein